MEQVAWVWRTRQQEQHWDYPVAAEWGTPIYHKHQCRRLRLRACVHTCEWADVDAPKSRFAASSQEVLDRNMTSLVEAHSRRVNPELTKHSICATVGTNPIPDTGSRHACTSELWNEWMHAGTVELIPCVCACVCFVLVFCGRWCCCSFRPPHWVVKGPCAISAHQCAPDDLHTHNSNMEK